MAKNLIRKYFDAYSGGPHIVFTGGFGLGLLLVLIGFAISNFPTTIIGILLILCGPLYCNMTKKKVDFQEIKFKIVLWGQMIGAIFFYILFLLNKFNYL